MCYYHSSHGRIVTEVPSFADINSYHIATQIEIMSLLKSHNLSQSFQLIMTRIRVLLSSHGRYNTLGVPSFFAHFYD